MAEQGRPRRRRRWIVPLVAIGAGVWFVRSRRIPVQGTWVPPLPVPASKAAPSSRPAPSSASAPSSTPAPRHAAATPEAATLDPEPTGEAPRHAAATTNGSSPAAAPVSAEPAVAEPEPAAVEPEAAVVEPETAVVEPEPAAVEPEPAAAEPAVAEPEAAVVEPEPAVVEPAPNPLFAEAPAEPVKGAAPLADGSAPGPEFVIKGNADSMLFHTESSPYYGRTKAEVWFRTEEEATAAGFTKWTRRRPKA